MLESIPGSLVLSLPTAVVSGVGFLLLLCLHLSYSLCGPSVLCWAEAVQSALSSFSRGITLYVGIDLVCPWRGIQGPPPSPSWILSPESITFDCQDYYNLPSLSHYYAVSQVCLSRWWHGFSCICRWVTSRCLSYRGLFHGILLWISDIKWRTFEKGFVKLPVPSCRGAGFIEQVCRLTSAFGLMTVVYWVEVFNSSIWFFHFLIDAGSYMVRMPDEGTGCVKWAHKRLVVE